MRRRPPVLLATLAVVAVAALAGVRSAGDGDVVLVSPGRDAGAVAVAHPGAVLELGPGRHGPFELTERVTVRSRPGAVVTGPVTVSAHGVHLDGLVVRGGPSGVVVREVDDVRLDDVVVEGAELHGIEVVDASARIERCRVVGLTSPYAQGIEVRNTNSRPRTVVEGCTVFGGQEAIVSHVSRVEFLGNDVRATTMRGIAVTEMSEGVVAGNRIEAVAGAAVFCGDMSHCEVRDNTIRGVAPSERGARSHAGHGVSVAYYSAARVRHNTMAELAGQEVGVFTQSRTVDDFPLNVWPSGWRGALPVLPVTAAGLAGLAAVAAASRAVLRQRAARHRRPRFHPLPVGTSLAAVVVGGFVVQSFHMVEHVVQVWQVHAAEGPDRSGVVGQRVDTEWVHFVYNAVVLGFLVQLWKLGRRQGWLAGADGAAPWLAGAVALQGFHLVEHSAKLWQHLHLGIDPGPGIVGRHVDLVWLHYGVNLAVWAGAAIALGALVRRFALERGHSADFLLKRDTAPHHPQGSSP